MAHPLPAEPARSTTQARALPPLAPERAVSLTVRIEPQQILNLFMALRRAMLAQHQVRILEVRRATIVQISGSRAQIDAAMQSVMQGLSRAEFGPVRAQAAS